MNDKTFKQQVIHHLAEQGVPADHDPWQVVQRRLIEHQSHRPAKSSRRPRALRLAIAISLAFIVVAGAFTSTPARRVLAETWDRLFTINPATEIPFTSPQEGATPTLAPTFAATLVPVGAAAVEETPAPPPAGLDSAAKAACEEDPYGYPCKIAWAEKKAGFDALEFASIPEALKFDSVYVYRDNDVIQITYTLIGGGGYFDIFQGMGSEIQSPTGSVPEEAIEEVWIGEHHAEFVAGDYATSGDQPVYTWTSAGRARLRWTDGERWVELNSQACMRMPDFCPGRDELIQMAGQLVEKPDRSASLRAEYLQDLDEAAQLAEFDVLAPAILPEGFAFGYASYDDDLSQLRLHYYSPGMDAKSGALVLVVEMPIEKVPLSPDWNGEDIQGESVEINGQIGEYFSSGDFYHTVTWQSGGIKITLSVSTSEWYGATFTREQVLEIARSVQ